MNPYYLAYCKAQGREPEAQKAHDTIEWPGGKMCGFMLWIQRAWREWSAETGEKRFWDGAWSESQRAMFSTWLEAK